MIRSDPVQLNTIINSELDKLNIRFAINKLSLNVFETNFMLFNNCKKKQILK